MVTGQEPIIQLSGIQFIREERHIVNDVNIRVNPGEHWVVLGRNGSGKTTLLEMMTGYMFPSRGRVEVLGNVFGQCDVREVRRSIGYISQSLFEKLTPADPVREVVATGAYSFLRFYEEIPQEALDMADAKLAQVELSHVANQPLGSLSQGERKKVMLARSLMQSPKLLILDEPCSGLDLFEREKLLHSIEGLRQQGMTIVYVTHHIEEIMPLFTHVLLLEQGQIIASGNKRDVLTADNLFRAYQVPVEVEWHNERPWIKVL